MSNLKPRQFNCNGALQLAYFAAEITLHRRIISSLSMSNQVEGAPSPPPQLIKVCRNAARTRLTASIEFTRDLKAEHLQAFWHSSAINNFALIGIFAAILYVTSDTIEEANSYKEQLYDYRWVLKVNSRSFSIANDALEKIDGVLRNIPGLLSDYAVPGANNPPMIMGPAGPLPQQQQQQPQQQGPILARQLSNSNAMNIANNNAPIQYSTLVQSPTSRST
ncbi:unnamed protein product [Ambrosiozyma monospora]|uniref:Unnamed protein product n=1 Tax=Ambrosiozyma monospora TaxID=43982 RepID=A0ACB5U7Z4_AMBMO|nr:unnamed protein product [Ambrosiozyma monospora]